MSKYILRLDDASHNMSKAKWSRMEQLLDQYHITPLVGVVPNNKDKEITHDKWNEEEFWEKCRGWKRKKWSLAQHGLNHTLHKHKSNAYFQKSHSTNTEMAGLTKAIQKEMLLRGFEIMEKNGIRPNCFFAPCHTYDVNTIEACVELGVYKYVSDGYALRVFKKSGMYFLPSVFDTPKRLLVPGVYTFVQHPNNMTEKDFIFLENFLERYGSFFVNADVYMSRKRKDRGQGLFGKTIENAIYFIRSFY